LKGRKKKNKRKRYGGERERYGLLLKGRDLKN